MDLAEYLGIPEYQLTLEFGGFWFYKYYNTNILVNPELKYKKLNTHNLSKDTTDTLTKQLQLPIKLIHNISPISITYNKECIYQESLINGGASDMPWYLDPKMPGWYILHVKRINDIQTRLFEPITIETHNIIQ